MRSRKATAAVLGFIAATRAEKRAQGQKQEEERQERERDNAWGLDAERLEGDEERVREKDEEGGERGGKK